MIKTAVMTATEKRIQGQALTHQESSRQSKQLRAGELELALGQRSASLPTHLAQVRTICQLLTRTDLYMECVKNWPSTDTLKAQARELTHLP